MINIATYSSENAKTEYRWVAYIVLSNGDYLGVMFRAATEDAVKLKAEQFWQVESQRPINQMAEDDETEAKPVAADPWSKSTLRGQQFVGKVWMRHKETRELIRVPAEQLQQMLDSGYEKSGPRAK